MDLELLVAPLLDLARKAGGAVCEHYHSADAGSHELKADRSPLTQADRESHTILVGGLASLQPSIPVLSEEQPDIPFTQRKTWQRHWLVDPLDGTREFLARNGQFTLNIALVEQHRPILGLLYEPLTQCAYIGIPGLGAKRYQSGPDGEWLVSELRAATLISQRPMSVLSSRNTADTRYQSCIDFIQRHFGPVAQEKSGSARKFCRMAEAKGDFYPRFSPCCEWDIAAGQALLEAAGGAIVTMDGLPLEYNHAQSLYCPDFFAIADPVHPLWRSMLDSGFAR